MSRLSFSRVSCPETRGSSSIFWRTPEELETRGPEIQELVRLGFSLLELFERTGTDLDQSGIARYA